MGDVKRYDPTFFVGENDEIIVLMEFKRSGDFIDHSDYATLLARHNALVEAVTRLQKLDRDRPLHPVADGRLIDARAEVGRLIATDCKGEG